MWQLAMAAQQSQPPQLDHVALFGFLTAVAALVCWVDRHRSGVLQALYGPCLAALAAYGFLAHAWPLGLVMLFASAVACYQFWKGFGGRRRSWRFSREARVGRLFRTDERPYWDDGDAGSLPARHPRGSNN
jgi:hypothetical protein